MIFVFRLSEVLVERLVFTLVDELVIVLSLKFRFVLRLVEEDVLSLKFRFVFRLVLLIVLFDVLFTVWLMVLVDTSVLKLLFVAVLVDVLVF